MENYKNIKLLCTDMDGVLTDDCFYVSSDSKFKKYNYKDTLGISMLARLQIPVAILTSSADDFIESTWKRLGVQYIYTGCNNKLNHIKELAKSLSIELDNIAYIGNDLNDYSVLNSIPFSFCPKDASEEVIEVSKYVLANKGGDGCLREVANLIFKELKIPVIYEK